MSHCSPAPSPSLPLRVLSLLGLCYCHPCNRFASLPRAAVRIHNPNVPDALSLQSLEEASGKLDTIMTEREAAKLLAERRLVDLEAAKVILLASSPKDLGCVAGGESRTTLNAQLPDNDQLADRSKHEAVGVWFQASAEERRLELDRLRKELSSREQQAVDSAGRAELAALEAAHSEQRLRAELEAARAELREGKDKAAAVTGAGRELEASVAREQRGREAAEVIQLPFPFSPPCASSLSLPSSFDRFDCFPVLLWDLLSGRVFEFPPFLSVWSPIGLILAGPPPIFPDRHPSLLLQVAFPNKSRRGDRLLFTASARHKNTRNLVCTFHQAFSPHCH